MKSALRIFTVLLSMLIVTALVGCGGAEERKEKYLEKGKVYLSEKNYDKARIEIKNVLQIDPKFAEAYYVMGQIEEGRREFRKAVGNYNKAVELDPKYVDPKIKLAKIYVIAGTGELIDKAKQNLQEVEKLGGANTETKLIEATIEYTTGSKQKAVADLEKLVSEDKHMIEGISLLASIYQDQGNEDKARQLLKTGVENNKDSIALRVSLARLLSDEKNYVEAEKYLKEVVNLEPDSYVLRSGLAVFYAATDQVDKAEKVLRDAIKEDDEDPQKYLALVQLLSTKVSAEKAVEELKQAIRKKPELYELQFALASYYDKSEKTEKAKNVLTKIIEEKSYDPEGIDARNKLAEIYLREGDTVNSKKYNEEVLAEHPNNIDALLTKGKLALSALDAVTAINGLRTVLKNDPKNAEAAQLLALAHQMNGESSLAENELKKAIEANPVNYRTHLNYARYLVQNKNYSEALNVTNKALTYFKDNYDLLDLKLKLVAKQNDAAKVAAVLDAMKRVAPENPEVYMKKGQFLMSQQKYDDAIAEFDKALGKTSNKYVVLKEITRAYMIQKKDGDALDRLNQRLQKDPADAAAMVLEGQVYTYKGDMDKARSFFNKAIATAPDWDEPYSSLAASYMVEKNVDKAIEVFEQGAKAVDNKAAIYMKIATLHEKQGNYDDAIKAYEKVLVVKPSNKLAANNMAALLLDYGDEKDVQKALDLAVAFKSIKEPALQDTLGWAYAKSGDYVKASEVLKSVVENAPDIAIFQYHLGHVLFHLNDRENAKKHLQLAVSSEQRFYGKEEAKNLLSEL